LTSEAHWRKEEKPVKMLIGTSIPDAVFDRISAGLAARGTVRGVWDLLEQGYEDRTLTTNVDPVWRSRPITLEGRVAADPRKGTQDEALSTDLQTIKKRDVECHNCHKRGHIQSECWVEEGGHLGG
jgi:hypothetical protein